MVGGANPAVAATAQSDSLNAVALFEPTMGSVMDEQERLGFGGAVARMGELAAEGKLTDAVGGRWFPLQRRSDGRG